MDKWTDKPQKKTIKVSREKAEQLQSLLDNKSEDKIGTIETFTAIFDDNHEIDIKVCQGNPPFVDAVLFIDGCGAGCLDVTDTLIGDYTFGNLTAALVIDE